MFWDFMGIFLPFLAHFPLLLTIGKMGVFSLDILCVCLNGKYLQNRKRSPWVYYIPLQRGKIALKHTAKAKKSEKNVVSYRGRRSETVSRGETVTPGHP